MIFFKILLCISISVVTVKSARILAWFPTPSISHQKVFRPLTEELAKRGHEVVVITTDPAFLPGKAPKNLTEIDVHVKTYNFMRKSSNLIKSTTGHIGDHRTQMRDILFGVAKIFEMQLNIEEVQKVLRQNFDLLIFEYCCRAGLALPKVLKVPLILIKSLGGTRELYDIMGAPSRPVLIYPTTFSQKINNLSITDRITELYNDYKFGKLFESLIEMENIVAKKYFSDSDIPDLRDLKSNVDLLFLNVNPIWDFNRPVPPGIVYIGGMNQEPDKELPEDLKCYLDSSKHGVIYISFGTNVRPSLLPAEKIQLMVKVVSQLPYDVLWKWDTDVLPGKTDNIRISKWFPQMDLLNKFASIQFKMILIDLTNKLPCFIGHPNVKVFITQGGLQSTDEAIDAGVPLLGLPLLADQWYNAEQYVRFKIGIRADFEFLNENDLKKAILSLINDESYIKNIVKLRNIMRDQPQSPLDRAVWWTEYVLRHGGAKHLRAPTANMTWSEYLDVELLAVLAGTVLISFVVLGVIVMVLYRFMKKYFSIASKFKKI